MFQTTQRIIEKTEGYLLGLPADSSLWSSITRFVVVPYRYLNLGIKELFKPVSLWALAAFALLVIATVIIHKAGIEKHYSFFIYNICIYAPMALVIFAVPSTYCFYGVSNRDVEKIVKIIEEESCNTVEAVELLEGNFEKIYDRVLSRISFYKWLIGAVWTFYIVILNIEIRVLLKVQEADLKETLTDNMFSWAVFIIITIVALVLVVGYKRASEKLIKSIEFSCVEHKYRLSKRLTKPLTRTL